MFKRYHLYGGSGDKKPGLGSYIASFNSVSEAEEYIDSLDIRHEWYEIKKLNRLAFIQE